ncbi:IucA/IucC family protein [Achromobacter aegrifaciens]|uniref:IucA/IucC family siderophore biosynthesis protein n=1 Tax=Achromobacter aegrifaciens TaxID=1287736 RepID=A0ABU2DJU5_ACHAE|nr:IucA/IucC family siderophore biosynthesis protein [Achromobacter aegrifaciens]MDR7948389.1 IucA/IucC family siderophore biosynthesis protein [Achromobacter aegrifaciens]
MNPHATTHPAQVASHLELEVWAKVNRLLVRKAISEYTHEGLLQPERLGPADTPGFDRYRLALADGRVEYRYDAQLMAMRHWRIRAESIARTTAGAPAPLDALQFVIEIRDKLRIPEDRLPIYLDEIASTLHGAAYKHTRACLPAPELALADYQTIETSMIEGHPSFVANNGRLGFDAEDYHAYAPEAAAPIRVMWLAVHKDNAHFACLSTMDYASLLRGELGEDAVARHAATLQDQGLDPADYYLMPAHPWQWFNKLSLAFAPYVAERKIVCLGYGEDDYLAQQSIRTFFNISQPGKHYVKTSLSILNMGFMRGLSPYYMSGTPAINEYIHGLIASDPWLRANGFTILREAASLGFRNYYYEAAISVDTPYKKMFSALWRENPQALIGPGERLMTMAALLHVDPQGLALLPALIRASGLSAAAWLERYVDAYLTPLVHCFYTHDLVFMPHGENVILVIRDHVPVRAFMKDIAEESSILDPQADLPENARRLAADVPEEYKLLTIFVDVFEGYFRHLSQILADTGLMQEDDFWELVAGRIAAYQQAHPQRLEKYRRYDLYAPDMIHSCLNRLQLANNLQMVNLADPIGSFQMAPRLPNPVAPYRPQWLDRTADAAQALA